VPTSFVDLQQQYGAPRDIPHEVLYDLLETNRGDLIDAARDNHTSFLASDLAVEVCRRSRTDLYWMSRWFTWPTNPEGAGKPISENLVTWEEYGPLLSTYIVKDDSKTIAEQSEIKNRMILWPRGGLKSTVDIVDTTQWILNFPEIRILFLTAADDLAEGFVKETKGHFIAHPDEPTWMNLFFPRFCVPESYKEDSFQFTCPVWAERKLERKEPTVLASSIVSNLSGKHFEVLKPDDMVSNINSQNEDQCKKVSKKFGINRKMLRPWGYVDFNGTRYSDADHYGTVLDKYTVGSHQDSKGPCWEKIVNEQDSWIILVGRGIAIKPERSRELEAENKPINYETAGEAGCNLLVPGLLPYKTMMKDWRADPDAFESQINQNPRPASTTIFDRPLLIKSTAKFLEIPISGPCTQVWDFAFSQKKKRDFSTGSNVMWDEKGGMFALDLLRDRYKPNDLAQAVVDFARKWRPTLIAVENAAGSQFLEDSIINKAKETNDEYIIKLCSTIDWFPVDTTADAKRTRMAQLHPLMVTGYCKLSEHLPGLSTAYDEFERCMQTARSSSVHDDIPDVLSHHLRYAPRIRQSIAKNEIHTYSRADASWNILFGGSDGSLYGGQTTGAVDPWGNPNAMMPAPVPIVPLNIPEVSTESYADGVPSILGAGIIG